MQNSLGILGFGVVGKSALNFLRNKSNNLQINIWDNRVLSQDEFELIKKHNANLCASLSLDQFIKENKTIFVSPGFSLDEIQKEKCKDLLCELNLFQAFYQKEVVAITGSLGKTTITSFLAKLAGMIQKKDSSFVKTIEAGNIGNAMLNIVDNDDLDIAFLELSSFQLKLNKIFSSKISIFNNFYPNHLNWHGTLDDYFESKCMIFKYQNKNQYSIFPMDFLGGTLPERLEKSFISKLQRATSNLCFVAQNIEIALSLLKKIGRDKCLVFIPEDSNFVLYEIVNDKILEKKLIFDLQSLPKISFEINWFFILSTLYLLEFNLKELEHLFKQDLDLFINSLDQQEHRLELFTTINGVNFYNDSKSTVYQATIKALEKLNKNGRPIILILGGLSKGVDRSPLLQYLKTLKNLKNVFCFGADCKTFSLYPFCSRLEDTVDAVLDILKPGDQVLFSPSGSSFDLFKNYQHRGEAFKTLIKNKFGEVS
ncbi:MAG: UDP-N-acetylmuramoyl-L-alanine--D-glutamate ligase [bacterium]